MNEIKFIDYSISKYMKTGLFHEGLASVQNRKGLYGFIAKNGIEIITPNYLNTKGFSEGLAAVQDPKTKLWGFINKKGELVIPYQYKETACFSEGYVPVQLEDESWTFIDRKGKRLIDKTFRTAYGFIDGYAIVKSFHSSLYFYLDKQGKFVGGTYERASSFSDGYAIVENGGKYYIIDTSFKIVAETNVSNFNNVYRSSEGMFLASKPGLEYGYINEKFKELISFKFKDGECFSDGMARVKLSSDWKGYVTKTGKTIAFSTKHQYSNLSNFNQGMARVQSASNALYGYINKKGEEIIKCEYEQADDFSEGLAGVIDPEGFFHYIDKRGNKWITIDKIYFSVLELDDKTIIISAETQEELATKKLQVLSSLKSEIINNVINNIDQIAYNETSRIPEEHYSRVRKPNEQ